MLPQLDPEPPPTVIREVRLSHHLFILDLDGFKHVILSWLVPKVCYVVRLADGADMTASDVR